MTQAPSQPRAIRSRSFVRVSLLRLTLTVLLCAVLAGGIARPVRAQSGAENAEMAPPVAAPQLVAETLPVADTSSVPVPAPNDVILVPSPRAPYELHIPSALPSGDAVNDQIWMTYYPAGAEKPGMLLSDKSAALLPPLVQSPKGTPAVVLLHYLGATTNPEMHRFARFLSGLNIASVVVTLPYHMKRLRSDDTSLHHYVDGTVDTSVQSLGQASSDVSTVISWLLQQPNVDPDRIGVVGVSLGGIVTHLVMGQDARISAGVAMLGGGDLVDSFQHSLAAKLVVRRKTPPLSARDIERLNSVDPLTYADKNRPRRVLMIQGARDIVIPPRSSEKLWRALGKPPIQWVNTNHLALRYAQASTAATATEFLVQVWGGVPLDEVEVPRVKVPTVTVGFIVGLDTSVTPVVQLQMFGIGTRNHLPILHGDLGVGTRGPYGGLAATVNQFVDVGVGRRLFGNHYRPYASFHFAF